MQNNLYIFLAIGVMFAVTFLIRVLPLTLVRRVITNRTVRSFLYYVPYVTLAVMTFPAILSATQSPIAAAAALAAGILAAWRGASLFQVASLCCGTVFVLELLLCR
jgi:branched-subunit amino acid transport protein